MGRKYCKIWKHPYDIKELVTFKLLVNPHTAVHRYVGETVIFYEMGNIEAAEETFEHLQ